MASRAALGCAILHNITWLELVAVFILALIPDTEWVQSSATAACTVTIGVYFLLKFYKEKQENEEYGDMSTSHLVLLAIEIFLQKSELVYFLLFSNAAGLILSSSAGYYVYSFIWGMFFKFQETDDVSNHLLFAAAGIVHYVYYKASLWPLVGWMALLLIMRLCWIWYQQWVIHRTGNAEPDDLIRLRIVSIQCSQSIGDSSHVYVVVGDDYTFELFKEGSNFIARPKPQNRTLSRRSHVKSSVFFIPFIQYGIVGVTTWSDRYLAKQYSVSINSMDDYSSSYDSCQEFAFQLIDRICHTKFRFNIRITSLKAILTILAIYAVPMFAVLYLRVTVHYKAD